MLGPNDRELLLDSLRPDPGFVLEQAVGTTYSLDLHALLMAPLAFALFDVDAGTSDADPIAILAALRSYANRIALYCDASRILVPPKEQRLFQLLEETIRPVSQNHGSFHPKAWVLRYRAIGGDQHRHRALVLSRNLTFDRSWDTVLRLDENLEGGEHNAQGLTAFLRRLHQRAPSPVVAALLRTLPRVSFTPPDGFDSVQFWPLPSTTDPMEGVVAKAALVISPFATARRLDSLARTARHRSLVTRAETLDRLGSRVLEQWQQVFILHGEAVDGDDDTQLSGLHAKTYVFDDGRRRRVFTGSANATSAAFGANVELLVELTSRHRDTRVGALLADDSTEVTLRRLLVERRPSDPEPLAQTPEEVEAQRLEEIVRALALQRPKARAKLGDDGRWSVDVELSTRSAPLAEHDALAARLVTSASPYSRMVRGPATAASELTAGSSSQVSSIIAFELTGDTTLSVGPERFVLLGDLENAPDDREDRLLLELLSNPDKVMRMLFLLLAAGRPGQDAADAARRMLASEQHGRQGGWEPELPLFENLVRTFSREPERLHAVRNVVARLTETEEGTSRFPDGFLAVWAIFAAALPKERT
jgi:hypothetical protein